MGEQEQRFRVFRIDLDENEAVSAVHALADSETADVIRELAGYEIPVLATGPGGALITLPVQVMLAVWKAQDTMPGTDPRYRHLVSSSLGRIYFGLISEE